MSQWPTTIDQDDINAYAEVSNDFNPIHVDPEFARTAQAYMAEFEQLLKRAAAGPRPVEESRDYLLSDRGRVYTMLAHASGRLN